MAKNLVEKGNLEKPLLLSNRSIKRAEELSSKLPSGKTKVVSSTEELVSAADIIFTCLSNDAALQEFVAIAVKGNVKGKLFVDCSTVHPDTTTMLAKTVQDQGADFVASPVFGAPAMAESGQLVIVLAGPASAVERVKPYTKGVMGRADLDLSDQPYAKATLLKVIGNTFILNMVETLAEGHTVAEKSGLGTEGLHKFVELMFPGPYTNYSSRMLSGDYYEREEPLFGVDLARKDAGHAIALAKASGTRMKFVEVADEQLGNVQKSKGSKGDIAGLYGAAREQSGLKYENQ